MDQSSAASSSDSEDSAVQIRITLALAAGGHPSLKVTSDPFAVPAETGRKGLAAIVNHLLDRNDDAVLPFDFIVGSSNRLLRTGLEREVRRSGLSMEEAVPVSYFVAQPAPEVSGESEKLDDWVGTLSYCEDKLFAGCYDGTVLCYSTSKTLRLTQNIGAVHTSPIKTVAAITASPSVSLVATGSMDQTLKILTMNNDKSDLRSVTECKDGHASSISSLDFSQNVLASGDWNGTLCLWDAKECITTEMENDAHSSKKSKTNSKNKEVNVSPLDKVHYLAPKAKIQAHVSSISGLSWGNYNGEDASSKLVTGSWDHGIKVWDVERQDCVLTLNGSKVVSCLDTSYHSEGIVATGHPDHTVRLWDTRLDKEGARTNNDTSFRTSHKAYVSAVQWSPHTPYHVTSLSHDGTMKVWDIRSPLPLHTTRAFSNADKGLCLAVGPSTSEGISYFLGGTDCVVKHYQCSIPTHQPTSL